ncbi:unnamed protein product [Amoebophrya sp. A120]|nr:unnamed protein product [Amoebophrya sp. A120]|eukprot:GSA120T00009401001.1
MNNRPQSRGMQSAGRGMSGAATPGGLRAPVPASRMGTSAMRMGTAAMRQGPGVGLVTDVRVQDRPLTQMGVHVNQGQGKPGRQIYDKSYYMTQLRGKHNELRDALQKFNQEMVEIQNDNNTFTMLEKRYEQLIKTVRNLEGELADYNLALDKQRTDTRPEEVQYMYQLLKSQNDAQRMEMDQIFLEKKSHEEEIKKFDEILESFTRADEEKLNDLHPDQRHEYDQLQQENRKISLPQLRHEVEMISQNLLMGESRLRQEPLRLRMQELKEKRVQLFSKLQNLEQQAKESQLSIPEQRDLLLQKVKDNNQEIVRTEERISETRKEMENCKKQLIEVNASAEQSSADQQKYEVLFTKDQEMSKFLEDFPRNLKDEQMKVQAKQQEVLAVLEDTSKYLGQKSQGDLDKLGQELDDELNFKKSQLDQSTATNQKLIGQVDKRKQELEKIRNLDAKISQELVQLAQKQQTMEKEIQEKYLHVDSMRAEKQMQTTELTRRKAKYDQRLAQLHNLVHFLQIKVDGKKQQLSDNETNQNLEALENKIKQYEQNLFHMQTFIATREAEADFSQQRDKVLNTMEAVNKILITNCMKISPMTGY